jgi:hypothetical protein
MKIYAAHYESPCNLFKGVVHIEAEDHKEAMSKFFAWLPTRPTWEHLWKINIHLQQVEKIEQI